MTALTSFCSNLTKTGIASLLLAVAAGCSSSDASPVSPADGGEGGALADVSGADAGDGGESADSQATTPTVVSTSPTNAATGVALNASATATFSEEMDNASLTSTSFVVKAGTTVVPGAVIVAGTKATFWPSTRLAKNTMLTVTITTDAKSASGVPLASTFSWSFTTGATLNAELPVSLGSAGHFAVLSKAGISTVPPSTITGDIGVSPAAATYITGFPLKADASKSFSTSPLVTGKIYAADYAPPTPKNMTIAIGDMQIAYTDAAARAADVTELGAGNVGGLTIVPGVYKWGTGLLVPTDVTLTGSATDVWVFQVAQNLTVSSGAKIKLAGGALPKNVYWDVAGLADLGTTSHLEGILMTKTGIALHTGATVNGRLFAQTAVTLEGNTIVEPAL